MSTAWQIAEKLARGVAAVRHARALHPRGRTYRATVRATGRTPGYGVDLLDRPGEYAALVRLSRGGSLPDGWPDVLGIGLRVYDGGAPGTDLDLLASTAAGRMPLLRHLPLPRRHIAAIYTTIAGYSTNQGRRYLAVLPDLTSRDLGTDLDELPDPRRERVSLLLAVASPWGIFHTFARITLREPVPEDLDARLAFDPVRNSVPGLRADGFVQRLRAVTYQGSREGRLVQPSKR
ncbi:MAG TPA: phosphodiesterase [Micromonosporaceae bacterium]